MEKSVVDLLLNFPHFHPSLRRHRRWYDNIMTSNNQSSAFDESKDMRPSIETGGRGIIARARDLAKAASWRKNDPDRKPMKEVHRPVQRRASVDCSDPRYAYSEKDSRHDTHGTTVSGKVRNGPPSRHISSDNLEPYHGGARRDDLGAATLHGNSDVSRVRSKKLNEKDSTKGTKPVKGDRRSQMKRAMSRENVKPPEEYGPNTTAVTKTLTQRTVAGGLYGNSPEPRRGRRKPVKPEQDRVQEDSEFERIVDQSEDGSSEGSFAEDDVVVQKQPPKTSNASTQRKKLVAQPMQRRDVLSLLRDKKKIQVSDMKDRDNRRILHFLIYQHSLNIDLTELQASVDHDIAVNGSAALRRPPLPLYVEPAN
jgi:hypothetical protein